MNEKDVAVLTKNDIKCALNNLKKNKWLTNYEIKEFLDTIDKNFKLEFKSPKKDYVFNAFNELTPDNTRILIIGQDPYPKPNKAYGLAFMHNEEYSHIDASLKNIYRAIWAYKNTKNFDDEDSKKIKWNTYPKQWIINNGVLLLNTSLTYEEDKLKTKHQNFWNIFIKSIITKLLTYNSGKLVVFLWGKDAHYLFFKCINSFGINNYDFNFTNKSIIDNKSKNNKIKREILCLTTGHPTPRYDNVHKYGFSKDAPKQFQACDEFLGKNIWLNFPENNK